MARSLNKAQILGHLGKDPIVQTFNGANGSTKNAKFSIATNYEYKDAQGNKVSNTEWHNIECWGPLAEIAERYLKKGDRVMIEGRIRTTSKTENDVTRYFTNIVANELVMLGGPNGSPAPEVEAPTEEEIPF